jgi:AAA domain-containing protein
MTTAMSLDALRTMDVSEVPNDCGRWLIHGPQGSGKSALAATIAAVGPTLYIDLTGEKGIRSFQGAPGSQNIRVVRPPSITELDDIFWLLKSGKHPFRAVVMDSLSSVQKMAMRFIQGADETAVKEIRQGRAPATMQNWGQTLDIMIDTATFWYGLADAGSTSPMHVVMTAQTKITESEDTGLVTRVPDVQRGALTSVLATPDYVLYTDLEENPDYFSDPDTQPQMNHIVRFGNNTSYRTKARLPYHLRGRIPAVMGRKKALNLVDLSRVLQIGGLPAVEKPAPAAAAAAATNESESA